VIETSHKHVLVGETQKKFNHGQHLLLSLLGLTMTSTVPPGRGLSASLPRHFVPGYYQPVPPGQKPLTHRAPRIKLALVGRAPARSGFQRAGKVSFGVGVPWMCLIRQERARMEATEVAEYFGRGRCFFALRESAKYALKSASNEFING